MNVDEIDSQRFLTALELFKDGQALTFDAVDYWLAPDGHLSVAAHSAWQIDNTNDERALAELSRAKLNLAYLMNNSVGFASLIKDLERRFSLIFFDGREGTEVARFNGESVRWI